MRVLGIDPGTTESAWIVWDSIDKKILAGNIYENGSLDMRDTFIKTVNYKVDVAAIEMIASYGMPVGKEVFETCVWIGRFIERLERLALPWHLVYRQDVKLHLCNTPRATDANVKQVLIDKYGGKGTKPKPGTAYGVRKDMWQAWAVAVTYAASQGNKQSIAITDKWESG